MVKFCTTSRILWPGVPLDIFLRRRWNENKESVSKSESENSVNNEVADTKKWNWRQITRNSTHRCTSLTCSTCIACISCITCIACITYITCIACVTFNNCIYRKSKKVWLADSLSDNLKSRDSSASKNMILKPVSWGIETLSKWKDWRLRFVLRHVHCLHLLHPLYIHGENQGRYLIIGLKFDVRTYSWTVKHKKSVQFIYLKLPFSKTTAKSTDDTQRKILPLQGH